MGRLHVRLTLHYFGNNKREIRVLVRGIIHADLDIRSDPLFLHLSRDKFCRSARYDLASIEFSNGERVSDRFYMFSVIKLLVGGEGVGCRR